MLLRQFSGIQRPSEGRDLLYWNTGLVVQRHTKPIGRQRLTVLYQTCKKSSIISTHWNAASGSMSSVVIVYIVNALLVVD